MAPRIGKHNFNSKPAAQPGKEKRPKYTPQPSGTIDEFLFSSPCRYWHPHLSQEIHYCSCQRICSRCQNFAFWHLRDLVLKPRLNCLDDILICLTANEGDTQTLCSKPSSTANSMQVGVCIAWQIVVNG